MNANWDAKYIRLADNISLWSKDPSKKIGAIAVGIDGQILSQGYNGFPRGINDTNERYLDREVKYKFIVHAEMNCIYNATLTGVSLKGSTLYVSGLPICSECAKGIIQVGIRRVVMNSADKVPPNWQESWTISKALFAEAGVEVDRV